MKPEIVFKHEFVEFIPSELKQGTIYVSMRFGTASHLCACGCGSKVVTPIRPTDWKLIYDGKSVSLDPSIGNWSFPCQSHYWIRNNSVRWADQWSSEKIQAGRQHDRDIKADHFGTSAVPPHQADLGAPVAVSAKTGFWHRLKNWLS